jgi:hypothetical protein
MIQSSKAVSVDRTAFLRARQQSVTYNGTFNSSVLVVKGREDNLLTMHMQQLLNLRV